MTFPFVLSKIIIDYLTPLPKLLFEDELLEKTYDLAYDFNLYWHNLDTYKNMIWLFITFRKFKITHAKTKWRVAMI